MSGIVSIGPAVRRDFQSVQPVRRVRSVFMALATDCLALWDIAAFLVCGYGAALFSQAAFHDGAVVTPFFAVGAGRCTVFCMALAPVLLRARAGDAPLGHPTAFGLRRLFVGLSMLAAVTLALGFLTRVFGSMPRSWAIAFAASALLLTALGRVVLYRRVRGLEAAGVLRDRVAIVGRGTTAHRFKTMVEERLGAGVESVGFFDSNRLAEGAVGGGSLEDLLDLGKRQALDWAVIAEPSLAEGDLEDLVCELKALDVGVAMCPPLLGPVLASHDNGPLGMPLITLAERPIAARGLVVKSLEDKILGSLILLMVAPVMLMVALAVRLDSPGPVLFRQRRHGWNNSEFDCFKFRTMTWNAAPTTTLQQTKRGDARITRTGRFLRASSLDELPQLFNVLMGQMSLVGPRPHPVIMRTEDQLGSEITAEYAHRHRVKPGITGWAQINGSRGATETAEQVRQRVAFDNHYIERWSLLFDLKILLMTPMRLLTDRNAF